MISEEVRPLFDEKYALMGWVEIDRSQERSPLDTVDKIDFFGRNSDKCKITGQERCGAHHNLNFLTALVGCQIPNQLHHGEYWDSLVQYHCTGYLNRAGDSLAAFIPTNWPALREYIQLHDNDFINGGGLVRKNDKSGKRFVHVCLAKLLTDPEAIRRGVLPAFFLDAINDEDRISLFLDEEAQSILENRLAAKQS